MTEGYFYYIEMPFIKIFIRCQDYGSTKHGIICLESFDTNIIHKIVEQNYKGENETL